MKNEMVEIWAQLGVTNIQNIQNYGRSVLVANEYVWLRCNLLIDIHPNISGSYIFSVKIQNKFELQSIQSFHNSKKSTQA